MAFVTAQAGTFQVALRLNGSNFYAQNIVALSTDSPGLVSTVTTVMNIGDYFECMTLTPSGNTVASNPISIMSLIQNF
jgi:hypothetical protein